LLQLSFSFDIQVQVLPSELRSDRPSTDVVYLGQKATFDTDAEQFAGL